MAQEKTAQFVRRYQKMLLLSAQSSDAPLPLMIIMMIIGLFAVFFWIANLRDENKSQSDLPSRNRQASSWQRSTPSKRNKQSFQNMKRIAVKKNGQYKYYRINKYGEIFEEPNEQE